MDTTVLTEVGSPKYFSKIHIFGEENTKTTAVFFIKYLRTLRFATRNDEKVDIGGLEVDIEIEKVDIQKQKVDIESVLSEKGKEFSVKICGASHT